MKRGVKFPHAVPAREVLKKLNSDVQGITEKQALFRRTQFGLNELPEKKKFSHIFLFLKQFKSLMIYILVIAATISFFIKHMVDVYIISFLVLFNTCIGFIQEYKAEKAINSLKKMIVLQAKVLRPEGLRQIPAKNLVPGDILVLEEGDKIPADARIFELKNFRTVEASLTGESSPIDKKLKIFPEKTSIADQGNMVWLGTFVVSGSAKAVVTATGSETVIGKIALSLKEIKPKETHFKKKTENLAKHMATIAISAATFIFLVGYFVRGLEFSEMFLFTLASLVSGIPEGLPAILSIVLAIGAFRMARRKAIIRSLPSTETLGVVNVIITDKTGTITENTMTIKEIVLPFQKPISVSGNGWNPVGTFSQNKRQINPDENIQLKKVLDISLNCNNAKLIKDEAKEKYKILGDPTEGAFAVLAKKGQLKKSKFDEKKIDDVPFDSKVKYRASLVQSRKTKKEEIYAIGAPEVLLRKSKYFLKNGRKIILTKKEISYLAEKIDDLTNRGMRALALACRDAPSDLKEISERNVQNLILVGFVGMTDPPRAGVKESIEKTRKAGIRVIMATGDHKNTALAVAKEIGLLSQEKKKYQQVYTGAELSELSEEKFEDVVKNVSVFARLAPSMKLKIAQKLQAQGNVIAMTGDGVNDAPALKQADIGISMGIIGTDVARESSEIILADDNFSTIVNGIEEARIVFHNTRQTSFFLVTTNFAEQITIIASLIFWMPLPLMPTQLLWLNLVTDSPPGLALAAEKNNHNTLDKKPLDKNENILNKEVIPFAILMAVLMTTLALGAFKYYLPQGIASARTAAFSVMAFTQIFNMFNMRDLRNSIFKLGFFSSRYINIAFVVSTILSMGVIYISFLQGIFKFTPIPILEFFFLVLISSSVFWLGELYKKVKYRN